MAGSHPSELNQFQVSWWSGAPLIAVGFEFSSLSPKSISFIWNNFWRKLSWSCCGSSRCPSKTSRAVLVEPEWDERGTRCFQTPLCHGCGVMWAGMRAEWLVWVGYWSWYFLPAILNPTGAPGAAGVLPVYSWRWDHAPWGPDHVCFHLGICSCNFLPPLVILMELLSERKSNSGEWKSVWWQLEANDENPCWQTLWFAGYLIKGL